MNKYLRWYAPAVWLGVLANILGFVVPVLLAPGWLLGRLHLPYMPYQDVWLRDAALLLLFLSITYLPSATDPLRYKVNAIVGAVGRLIFSLFWIWPVLFAGAPRGFLVVGALDGIIGLTQGILLYLLLREEDRFD
ncbi:MAG: hypothetical protein ACJ74Q_10080 [Pyrinomonadaceae bacterium]